MKAIIAYLGSVLTGVVLHAADTAPDFIVHEWGTFTTVSGSDGILLTGLQREEEALPGFVESHDGMTNLGAVQSDAKGKVSIKGWIRPLKNVTVKMETPVIYFYTTKPFQARVSVDFHGGSISQWYPSRSGGETLPPMVDVKIYDNPKDTVDFAKKYEGSIKWDVTVTPPAESDSATIFKGNETPSWLFPRQPNSALVHSGNGAADKFLFYRGVGNFDLPVVCKMGNDNVLVIQNRGHQPIPRLFVYDYGMGGMVRFRLLDALPAGQSTQLDLTQVPSMADWHRPVYETLAAALLDAGLYRPEADAMLQTWWRSYFARPGLRVFWIVPDAFVEKILPLHVNPIPQTTKRVLVGRSEILIPQFERALVKEASDPDVFVPKNDRYLEAYGERIRQLREKR